MLLTALVSKAELAVLVRELTPLRIVVDAQRGRFVTLARPELTLVAGKGIRLCGEARIAWDVAGLAVPVTIQRWQLLLAPRVEPQKRAGAYVLAFEPTVEALDLKLVPAFFDDKIAGAIADWIAKNRSRIAWNFARVLTKRLTLPVERFLPTQAIDLAVTGGEAVVRESELELVVRLAASVTRAGASKPVRRAEEDVTPASRPEPARSHVHR